MVRGWMFCMPATRQRSRDQEQLSDWPRSAGPDVLIFNWLYGHPRVAFMAWGDKSPELMSFERVS